MKKQYQILLPIPDGLVIALEDYRASFRPVLTRRAAIQRLIDEGIIRWLNSPDEATVNRLAAELESDNDEPV